jgi:hypothetical protein
MAKQHHDGRNTMAKGSTRENVITAGGIETPVHGFFGNITTEVPWRPVYGDHKKPGSEMAPMVKGGRGGSKPEILGKLYDGQFPYKGKK